MKGSLRILFVLVACVGTMWWLPAPVFASTIGVEFTGRVIAINDQTLLPNLTGGSVVTGMLSFDSSAPDQNPALNQGEYLFGPPFTLTVTVETLIFTQTLSTIVVFNDLSGSPGTLLDRFYVRADGTSASEFAELYLDQRSASLPILLSSDALPVSELDLGLAQFPRFQFFTRGLGIVIEIESFSLGPEPVGGAVTGMSPAVGTVTCRNLTTKKTVKLTIPAGAREWNCEHTGLVVNPGDEIRMTVKVKGPAD